MEVRQTFRNDGWGEQCVKETVIPDPKPVYPVRHVVDGVLLVTLPAAHYDGLVADCEELVRQTLELVEEVNTLAESERMRQEPPLLLAAPPAVQSEPPNASAPLAEPAKEPTHRTKRKSMRH